MTTFSDTERARAAAWKQTTDTLPDEARAAARYVRDGDDDPRPYGYCLPSPFSDHNLLPEVRALALELFDELGIRWHNSVDGRPTNHLLSSQVQCVNALGQMVHDPDRVRRSFGGVLDIDVVEPIEPGRYLTFEYIGPTDYFGESPGTHRTRGAHCTSVDAAFVHRTRAGERELVLVEWKYTESYRPREPEPRRDAVRRARYGDALADPGGPVRHDLLAFEHLCQEPIYQLVRQQLLAHELEKAGVLGADRVRVVHVKPAANVGYQTSLTPALRALGSTVSEVWRQLLRHTDRFVELASAVFLDPTVTSTDYIARYGDSTGRHAPTIRAELPASIH